MNVFAGRCHREGFYATTGAACLAVWPPAGLLGLHCGHGTCKGHHHLLQRPPERRAKHSGRRYARLGHARPGRRDDRPRPRGPPYPASRGIAAPYLGGGGLRRGRSRAGALRGCAPKRRRPAGRVMPYRLVDRLGKRAVARALLVAGVSPAARMLRGRRPCGHPPGLGPRPGRLRVCGCLLRRLRHRAVGALFLAHAPPLRRLRPCRGGRRRRDRPGRVRCCP